MSKCNKKWQEKYITTVYNGNDHSNDNDNDEVDVNDDGKYNISKLTINRHDVK